MQVATSMAAKAVLVPEMEVEERYVKVASRFFRVKPRGGDGAMTTRGLHYLNSCFLCKKDIAGNRDIFMYKGDAAFCSEDCREEQMYMDEALDAVAWRHRHLPRAQPSSSSSQTAACAAARGEEAPLMRRRPTIANLAARNPPVAAT